MKCALLGAMLAIGMLGCGKGPSEGQCKQLLEHLVDLEIARGGAAPAQPAGADAPPEGVKQNNAKQRDLVIEAKSPEFMTTCVDKIAKSRVQCALVAKDLDTVAKCDE